MKKHIALVSCLCALAIFDLSSKFKSIDLASPESQSRQQVMVEALDTHPIGPPAPAIQKDSAVTPKTTLKDQALQIENLSQIVFYTPAKKKALRALLANPKMRAEIDLSLNDANDYSGEGLQEKLRFLDVLYEGLKFPEAEVSQPYFTLAQSLLSERVPEEFGNSKDLRREFIADRTEIAMAMLSAFPDQAKAMESAVAQKSAEGLASFKNARRLKGLYEVAL